MGTTSDKLNYLQDTKEAIKTAIEGKDVTVPPGTTFREYADLIDGIYPDALFLANKTLPSSDMPTIYTSSQAYYTGMAYGNGVYIAVGNDNSYGYYLYAIDGSSWTKKNMGVNAGGNKKDVFFENGKFIMINDRGNQLHTSTDGLNWTTVTLPASDYWENVVFTNGTFFLFPCSNANSSANITNTMISRDGGTSWSKGYVNAGGVTKAGMVRFDESTKTFYRMVDGSLYVSTDGLIWSLKYSSFGYNTNLAVGNNIVISTNSSGTNVIFSVDGGTTLKSKDSPVGSINNFNGCAFYNGVFYFPNTEQDYGIITAIKVDDTFPDGIGFSIYYTDVYNNHKYIDVVNNMLVSLPHWQSSSYKPAQRKCIFSCDGLSWTTEINRKILNDVNKNNKTFEVLAELQGIPIVTLSLAYKNGVNSYE